MHIVYGGAFNPPTKAHREVYRYLCGNLPVERFTFLPVSTTYQKDDLESNKHRYNMLKLLAEELKHAEVSDLEMQDEQFRGTYYALKRLQKPGEKTAFVIGADHLRKLKCWVEAKRLLEEFYLVVLNRGGENLQDIVEGDEFLRAHEERFFLFPDFHIDVSASDFRKSRDKNLVVDSVYAYIVENDLYKG